MDPGEAGERREYCRRGPVLLPGRWPGYLPDAFVSGVADQHVASGVDDHFQRLVQPGRGGGAAVTAEPRPAP